MTSKPMYHFTFMGRRYKACEVMPAYTGSKYDPESDILITEEGKSFTRSDCVEYNPDIKEEATVSFQVLMMILTTRSTE